MRWATVLVLFPALALAGGFSGSISSSGPAGVLSGGGSAARSVIGYGDSIMAGTGGGSPLPAVATALGPGTFSVNAGVPGDSSGGIASRYAASEATACGPMRCTHLWLEGGTNDLRAVSPATPASVLANMLSVVDDALTKGYVVLWSDILPCRGYVDANDASIDRILAYNALMQSACTARAANARLRCFFGYPSFVDPARLRMDGVTPAGYLLSAYSEDELHLSTSGVAALSALAVQALP